MKSTKLIQTEIHFGWSGHESVVKNILRFVALHYKKTGTLAVCAFDQNGEPFADITVCLGEPLMPGFAYVDTNNCPWAERLLAETGIAKPAKNGAAKQSGYCTYPLYEFDMTKFSDEYSGSLCP